ncbi:unnamed protein product [Arctia plantaginis]|uniref:Uncharacterized protein n=1 Tax=Arctia plantaginis TaxID=874455 RepID=A0A8S0ZA81_ARCPL|nr:unnamed protein product [Arctia plantaginis]
MKLFIITAVFALSSAAELPSRNYIPPGVQGGQGNYHVGGSGAGHTGNRRPQQDAEKNAAIIKQEQVISENGNYHFGYETSNGIRAEEAGDTVNAQGGFAYIGDDGHTYTVTYTAGEGGFRPQGEHLPVPPPTPVAILEALKKNEQDEAAGIFDDGKYHPEQDGGSHNVPNFGSPNHQGSFSSSGGYKY